MRALVSTLLVFLLVVPPGVAQQPTLVVENARVITGDGTAVAQERPEADPADVESPGAVVQALVESYSSEAGERPDWDRYRSLFLPKARLISTSRDSAGEPVHHVRTVQQVVERLNTEQRTEEYLDERLIHTEIDRFGDIAHVLYTYEVFDSADHAEPAARGVASLQLWYDGERWWIMTLTFHPERKGAPIPERYGG